MFLHQGKVRTSGELPQTSGFRNLIILLLWRWQSMCSIQLCTWVSFLTVCQRLRATVADVFIYGRRFSLCWRLDASDYPTPPRVFVLKNFFTWHQTCLQEKNVHKSFRFIKNFSFHHNFIILAPNASEFLFYFPINYDSWQNGTTEIFSTREFSKHRKRYIFVKAILPFL